MALTEAVVSWTFQPLEPRAKINLFLYKLLSLCNSAMATETNGARHHGFEEGGLIFPCEKCTSGVTIFFFFFKSYFSLGLSFSREVRSSF